MNMSAFKQRNDKVDSEDLEDQTSSTEPMEEDDYSEEVFREEVKAWIAISGKSLFAVEAQKFLAQQNRRDAEKARSYSGRK